MALPDDVTTCTITFPPDSRFRGLFGQIVPSPNVRHRTTGQVIPGHPIPFRLNSHSGAGSVTVPHTDLAVYTDVFVYTVVWSAGEGVATPEVKEFSVPASLGATVAFGSLPNVSRSNSTGPQGPQGPTGPQGPPGIQGPAGSNATVTDSAVATQVSSGTATQAALGAAYVPSLPTVGSLTYNGDGTIASDPDGNTYTWNTDGTPATQTKGGVTRTFHWNADGTLASVS